MENNYVFFIEGFKGLDILFFLDIQNKENVKIITRRNIFRSNILKFIFILHFSHKISKIIKLPLKNLWYSKIFKNTFRNNNRLYFIFSPGWYYPKYVEYLKKMYKDAKFIIYFSDTIESKIKNIPTINIKSIKKDFDLILSYNPEDVKKYDLKFSSIYYSKLTTKMQSSLPKYEEVDILFIGAAKNRLEIIEKLYDKFIELGLKCFFYVVVDKNFHQKKNQKGIIFSKKMMPFNEYLARIFSTKHILEVLDPNTSGCTLRFWEAVMYNKKLISNFKYLKNSKFYSKDKMLYFENLEDIKEKFFLNKKNVHYNYQNENSPINFLKKIDELLQSQNN